MTKGAGTGGGTRSPAVGPPDATDRRDGECYLMPEEGRLAVEVALATGRPLLLRGKPGCGKSSLAAFEAARRKWRYYEHVVTYRTQARDLLWSYDTVRRLADAQARANGGAALDDHRYVRPGALWWAFAPELASRRGAPGRVAATDRCPDPSAVNAARSGHQAVILIDEIDKADPDVPNSLLVPLGSGEFTVTDTGTEVRKEPPPDGYEARKADQGRARHLVVITTNEERELPQAFLRRCVVAWLDEPDRARLGEIAKAHLEDEHWGGEDEDLADAVAEEVVRARERASHEGLRTPSTAEFLDALRACRSLGIIPGSDDWERLKNLVLIKRQQPKQGAAAL